MTVLSGSGWRNTIALKASDVMPEGAGTLPFCIRMMALRTSLTLGGSPRLRNLGRVGMIGKVESSQGSGSGLLKTLRKCSVKTSGL
eukprot:9447252-Ditylum_brightwellii.AAC.1